MLTAFIKMGVIYALMGALFWVSFVYTPLGDRLTTNLLSVLLHHQGYGMSPEEETQHARLWACLVILAFALGLAWR